MQGFGQCFYWCVFHLSSLLSFLWLHPPYNSSSVWKKWSQAMSGSQWPGHLRPQREKVPLSEIHFGFWELTVFEFNFVTCFVWTKSRRWALWWQLGGRAHVGSQGVLGWEVLVVNLLGKTCRREEGLVKNVSFILDSWQCLLCTLIWRYLNL